MERENSQTKENTSTASNGYAQREKGQECPFKTQKISQGQYLEQMQREQRLLRGIEDKDLEIILGLRKREKG